MLSSHTHRYISLSINLNMLTFWIRYLYYCFFLSLKKNLLLLLILVDTMPSNFRMILTWFIIIIHWIGVIIILVFTVISLATSTLLQKLVIFGKILGMSNQTTELNCSYSAVQRIISYQFSVLIHSCGVASVWSTEPEYIEYTFIKEQFWFCIYEFFKEFFGNLKMGWNN